MTKDIYTPFAFVGRLTGFAQHADMDGVLFHMFLRRHVLTKIQLVPLGLSVGGQRSINQPTLNLLTYYFTHIFHSASCVINVRVWKRRTRQCPPLHLIFFFCEVLVRMADCAPRSDGGSCLSKYTVLQRKDLTLKFLQTTVARICHCLIFFVVAYSYTKCKVLYESCLISSHIFIPDPPTYLTPPLPAVGKTSPGQDVEDSGNYLEDGQGRRVKKKKKKDSSPT